MILNEEKVRKEVNDLQRSLQEALHSKGDNPNLDFLISSLTEYNPFNTTEEIIEWLHNRENEEQFDVEIIPLAELRKWYFDPYTGDLAHGSGGYFAIRGLEVYTNIGPVRKWRQPIIDQPKIGLLGILTKKIDGILYFLMQAKAEPGNINSFQISPTVQATRSNYMRMHQGKPTRFLEFFINGDSEVLFDQLQSEQGARFFRKRNRNMIVRISEDSELDMPPSFKWLTLGQIKQLMQFDNVVNMDARSVISNISFCQNQKTSLKPIRRDRIKECIANTPLVKQPVSDFQVQMIASVCSDEIPHHSMGELMHNLCREKFECELETRLIPLNEVDDWLITPRRIIHDRGLYFSVIGVRVEAENREVSSWDQPIIQQHHSGIVGFIAKEINGAMHFLIQLKMESGNIDLLEMAPTVQCITGSYEHESLPPYVGEMLDPQQSRIVFSTMQSEEGGRFYREENRNILLMADDDFPIETPKHYIWVSYKQLKQLLMFNNFLNVESRSLLALI